MFDMNTSAIIQSLEILMGRENVLTDPDLLENYAGDWSSVARQVPTCVVRPASTVKVSTLLKYCTQERISVVTQGGRTGLCGGANPRDGEIVLSLERMNTIHSVDTTTMTITVDAGATLQAVQEAAHDYNVQFPLDLGARGTCTVGGNAATNAGGNRVIKYGMMRDLVLGVEAVLPNGDIVGGLNAMIKNNAGYDLKHFFIGTEGTLGIITKLVLKLFPRRDSSCVALCALSDFSKLAELLSCLRQEGNEALSAFEVMWDDYFEAAIEHTGNGRRPFQERHQLYALVELQGTDDQHLIELAETILSKAIESDLVDDVIIGQSLKDNEELWSIRDGIGDLLPILKPFIAFDISFPLTAMQSFAEEVKTLLSGAYPESRLLRFGHLGDGNLHLTVHYPDPAKLHEIEDKILQLAGSYNGSISGEHGIGIIKKPFLGYSRSAPEIELMRTLKRTLDPQGILNAGRVFD